MTTRPRPAILTALGVTAVAGLLFAASTMADQVILDDLIVDGSACIGFDCVNGESFGFDTIRLKENNLRIRFQDTSSSAGFPSNDWQITANDSSNGGKNKFSIDDIDGGRTPFTIEAGAPSNSLYVDDGGRLGLGTNTPVTDIHVVSGNTPTLRLEQNGSSGFTPQTFDVAGNEAGFFVRDATNGSTLPLRIRSGAPSSSLDIAADGDIGMGTSFPGSLLHVVGGDGTLQLTDTLANSTNKNAFVVGTHFTTAEEQVSGLGLTSSNAANVVNIGGGSASYNTATDISFFTAANTTTTMGTERMRIASDGNVGIGTDMPSAALHVSRTNGNVQLLVEATAGGTALILRASGVPSLELDNTSGGTATRWRFRAGNAGNFVINAPDDATTGGEFSLSPAGNLTVAGNLFSTACPSPTPCAPDYVFEAGYDLMPLSDLADFVAENKHLPNVPSAEELVGPISNSALQLALLEKIEELTLYTIEQEDTIADLEARLAALEARLAALEAD